MHVKLDTEEGYQKSIDILNKLLEVDPNNIDCMNDMGYALMELSENEEAIEYFNKCATIG